MKNITNTGWICLTIMTAFIGMTISSILVKKEPNKQYKRDYSMCILNTPIDECNKIINLSKPYENPNM